ncbi:MAG: fructokinase [Alphaproteobacteria bacterium]|nr:fructokinase [Alphaproteobacteria bacterium]
MRIGIDFGGTKTEIICLDSRNGKELYRQRVPTRRGDYTATVLAVRDLVQQAEQTLQRKGTVGVGIPGTIVPETGLVKNANSTWLIGQPFMRDLSKALQREVRMENDANCLAVSEATDGVAEGRSVVFAAIIGTGCGAGIAIDGRAHVGINSIAGEWGHNPLPYPVVDMESKELAEHPGPECYCGRYGCIETWISGTGFRNDYMRVTGTEMSTHDIIAAAKSGAPDACAALQRYTDRLARSLAGVINILDPDVIVLGGGMSNVQSLYSDVPEVWKDYVFSDTVKTPLCQARHGDSSGVRGAAWLWGRDEVQKVPV